MAEKNFLVDHLISGIKSGTFQLDKKLPSEHILADQFNVPRMVVRKAYEQLQDSGFIYSKQGKGSYVQETKKQIPLILSGFTEKMKEFQFSFQTSTIFCEEISYDQKIFRSLEVESDVKVFKIGRLMLMDDFPVALHTSFAAKSTIPEIEKDGPEIPSMFQYYRQRGFVEFGSSRSTLNVIFPTLFERDILQCSSLIPILQVESLCRDKRSNQVLEHTVIIYRSDCFIYVI
ncbi:GntR family transcriptional regulator [Peribacillus frigoritolerans]|uniref:GntR family transcriptional regulator n=1 Tax=Peribacillus frigoritolerans TaxID=450367 RepID=UPI00207A551E|nr:GntR family transcriptional regulator [Peribacillus frigoritolerans]USK73823.1 GntR family transcriptional regulator [Peribacillus frigoritolerans]